MAMDVVTVAYLADCTMQSTRIHFELDIPVPPGKAAALKAAMDSGDWASVKAQAKAFAPLAVSGSLDYFISVAPQKSTPPSTPAVKKPAA
ncbi:hypothetical protein [Magnetovibrio blakemorei]|uniref:Uncharacterized protein n=1 Tax=Magnetovibrio blakemorei TaxID=28181 RepID=A0A1E5QAU0_9PROT|nr:hypothetical protein [Magnetovibrio blakemorei]OEJ69138.1 hypothetical protein BEN30_03280 [Magnetovibrio blakemorei]